MFSDVVESSGIADSLVGDISSFRANGEVLLALALVVETCASGLLFLAFSLSFLTIGRLGLGGVPWYISVGVGTMLVGVSGRSLFGQLIGGGNCTAVFTGAILLSLTAA